MKYKEWINAGVFSGMQKLTVPLSGVVITMILAHKALTKEEMGVWAIFMSITAVMELIRQGLVKTSMIRFLNQNSEDDHSYILGSSLILNGIITILVFGLLFLATPFLSLFLHAPKLKDMLFILQFGVIIWIAFSHLEWFMYSHQLFKNLFLTYLVRQSLTLVLIASVYFITGKVTLKTLVHIYNISMLAGMIMSYISVKPLLKHKLKYSTQWVLQLFGYGKYIFVSGLSTLVFRSADQIMLSPILGTSIYNGSQNIAMRFVNLADLPSQTLGDILFPKSSKLSVSRDIATIKRYYEKAVGVALSVVLPLVLIVMVFPKLIIFLLAGPQYYEAIPYLRIISLSTITLAFLKQYGVIMDSTGRQTINLITISIMAGVQVLLLYYFINKLGLMGAGYALLLSHFIGFALSQFILYRIYRINFVNGFINAFLFYPEIFRILKRKIHP